MKAPFKAAFLVWALLASTSLAVSPAVRGMKPVGGRRGTDVVVTLSGQRLADTRGFLFYRPGIAAKDIKAGEDGRVTATFAIAPDAELGLHDFRLVSATGISPLRTFSVGALDDVDEVEPNNDFAAPQPIAMNVTVNGVATNEDVDYYAVRAKKGDRITAEIEGIRLGLSFFDPYVAILDDKRFELASSDDSSLTRQDGFVSVIAPEDGTYIIVARESAYAGNPNCLYRLHVGDFPRPSATFPAGGKVGESVSVRWVGDVLGERTTAETLPASLVPNFGLLAHDERGTAPYPNAFRLSPFGNALEVEPNDSAAKATPFTPPVALNGIIGSGGDVDHFVFEAKKGQTYDVRVFARQIGSPLDSVLSLSRRDGKRVAANDDAGGPDSSLRFSAPGDGAYVVSVTDHLKKGGPDFVYRVEIRPVEPRLTLSTPNEAPRRGAGTMAVAVPKGNRQAILINASRADFRGALTLSADGLPPGVRFEADAMPAGISTLPVLFTADSGAETSAALADVSGRLEDTSTQVPAEFTSTAELVIGQNNIPVWTRTVDRLAVAVTEEAPFSIEIVEPKVPIVRGGSMDLKVVARRKPGFTAPIAVMLPWNPPGISSKRDIVIPDGANEAMIPVNANNGAELATWRIVANGTYTEIPPGPPPRGAAGRRGFRGGRLTVSSDFAKLTVAPPFVKFRFAAVSVEQGKEADLVVRVEKAADFPGEARITLLGLPNKATTEPATITKETSELVFHLKTDAATPAGETKSLFCQVVFHQDGEPIVHNLGNGRLRVDAPIARKPAEGTAPEPSKTPVASASAPAKPLGRLEKLRLESRERAKAQAVGLRADQGAPDGASPTP